MELYVTSYGDKNAAFASWPYLAIFEEGCTKITITNKRSLARDGLNDQVGSSFFWDKYHPLISTLSTKIIR